MSDPQEGGFPSQQELEKEISHYLSEKYGRKVKIVSSAMLPWPGREEEEGGEGGATVGPEFAFDLAPEELIAHLDQYVVGQSEAKAVLATKICTHFNRISRELNRPGGPRAGRGGRNVGRIKHNVLLIGPTGVGKTFLIKLIADRLGVPFVKGDATKFSETGYVGGDVEDLIRDLAREADNDLERARFGIVYLDEVDKIAGSPHRLGADVSRAGVQRALLKPMEETEVELKVPHDPISQIEAIEYFRQTGKRQRRTVNTRHILFIMSGAFADLDEIIRRRVGARSIGFENKVAAATATGHENGRLLRQVRPEDLVAYGFESEFIGRLPVVAVLDELREAELYEILRHPNSSVVVGKRQDFRAYGIELAFEDEALQSLAVAAGRERTGARGLVSVMERTLLHFEKKLPSTAIRHLVVSAALVENPGRELLRLLNEPAVQAKHRRRWQQLQAAEQQRLERFILENLGDYLERQGIVATPARLALIAGEVQSEELDPHEACDRFVALVAAANAKAAEASEVCGTRVSFSDEALDRILARQPRDEESVRTVCDQVLQAMSYGLRLLTQCREVEQVVVPAAGIDAPDIFINEIVCRAFKVE